MNNLWNRSVGPFDEAAAQRHRHMGLLDCNGGVNADAVISLPIFAQAYSLTPFVILMLKCKPYPGYVRLSASLKM